MNLPQLSREEFKMFGNNFKLDYIYQHGQLLHIRIVDEKIVLSIFTLNEFRVKVLKTYPQKKLIVIKD